MENLTLYTSSGSLKVISHHEFVNLIIDNRVEVAPTPYINYPIKTHRQTAVGWSESDTLNPPDIAIISTQTSEMKYLYSSDTYRIEPEEVRRIHVDKIIEQFSILIAKSKSEFFIKDLKMESIQSLAMKHLANHGQGEYAVMINLTPYSKFLAILNLNDFKLYLTKKQCLDRPQVEYHGALVNLAPTKMIMGRYENPEFYQEMAAQRRYDGTTLGYQAGSTATTGSNNICIGSRLFVESETSISIPADITAGAIIEWDSGRMMCPDPANPMHRIIKAPYGDL